MTQHISPRSAICPNLGHTPSTNTNTTAERHHRLQHYKTTNAKNNSPVVTTIPQQTKTTPSPNQPYTRHKYLPQKSQATTAAAITFGQNRLSLERSHTHKPISAIGRRHRQNAFDKFHKQSTTMVVRNAPHHLSAQPVITNKEALAAFCLIAYIGAELDSLATAIETIIAISRSHHAPASPPPAQTMLADRSTPPAANIAQHH